MWPCLPTIYQYLLQYQNYLLNDLVGKNFFIQDGFYGVSSIINVVSLIYYDNKMNCVYCGNYMKLSLSLRKGQPLQF